MRKKGPGPEDRGLPPEGLWVSPEGEPIPVIEHLIELQESPKRFGLSPRDVARADIQGLRTLAVGIIKEGWTRFRYLSGVWNFEVDNLTMKIGLIEEILVTHQAWPQESVVISQVSPKREYQGTVAEFYDRRMFRHYGLGRRAPGNSWRFS